MSQSTRTKVEAILRQIAGPDVDFNDTKLAFRSIQMLEFIVALENEFGVKMSEDAPLMEITQSVDNVLGYLGEQGIR